jgi:nephrocystin-3
MQDERELIVKRAIPKIRKMCIERDISFSYVDLRWGITGVQNENAATLLMCLREIDKSSIFCGMYGERYGWCLSQSALKNRPTSQGSKFHANFDMF